MLEPHSKDQLLKALHAINAEVSGYFSSLQLEVFFAGSDEAWSPAHHLQHLIQSNQPLAKALGVPKMLLKVVSMGKTPNQHRSYSEVVEIYKQALADGRAKATGRYAPKLEVETSVQGKETILEGFAQAGESAITALNAWQEPALDEYALPHPVLGQLRVREMLFFTLYHNGHHLEGVRSKFTKK